MTMEGLILNIKQQGAPETAAALQDVARAQAEVVSETKSGADTAREAADAIDGLNTAQGEAKFSGSSLVGVLRRIHPELGNLASAAMQGGRALSSMLGGGALVGGLIATAKAVSVIRAEIEKMNQTLREQSAALNELEARRRGLAQGIEEQTDRRPEGGLSADESRSAAQLAQRIAERFGGALSEDAVEKAVGTLFGRGASDEQITQAAILQQMGRLDLDPAQHGGRAMSQLAVASGRHGEAVQAFIERETRQVMEEASRALTQAMGVGGQTLDLEKAVRESLGPGTTEAQVARIVELAQSVGGNRAALERALSLGGEQFGVVATVNRLRGRVPFVPPEGERELLGTWDSMSASERAQLETVLNRIERSVEGGATPPTVVNNYNQGQRFFASDGRTQRDRMRTAESTIAEIEER
jgi:hypothetical protein